MQIKVALVNNQHLLSSKFISYFERRQVRFEVLNFQTLHNCMNLDDHFNALILSGTDDSPYDHPELYRAERSLLRRCQIPVLGICGGHQILCQAFGGRLAPIQNALYGRTMVSKVTDNPLLDGLPENFIAFSKHRFCVTEMPRGFRLLSVSTKGQLIYGVRHEQLPKFGVQFHPERGHEGERVLDNFLALSIAYTTRQFTASCSVKPGVIRARRKEVIPVPS